MDAPEQSDVCIMHLLLFLFSVLMLHWTLLFFSHQGSSSPLGGGFSAQTLTVGPVSLTSDLTGWT